MKLSGLGSRRLRLTILITASLCAPVQGFLSECTPAYAGDWSLKAKVGEKAEFTDNYRNLADSDGFVATSRTEIYGDLSYLAHDRSFDLIADIVALRHFGEGADSLSDKILPSFQADYHQDTKRNAFDFGASYSVEFIPALEQLDIGTDPNISNDDTRHTLGFSSSMMRRLTPRSSISWNNSLFRTEYTGSGFDNLKADTSLTWTNRLTKRTDGSLTLGFTWLTLDDEESTQRRIYRSRAGVSSQLTHNLKFGVGAGVNFVETRKTDIFQIGQPEQSDSKTGFLADARIDYQLKALAIALSADYGFAQGTLGDLQNRANLNIVVSKPINERSSVSLSGNVQSSKNLGSDDDRVFGFSVSPNYTLLLTDEWTFQAGYRFVFKDTQDGHAKSNNVFFSMTRDFIAVP